MDLLTATDRIKKALSKRDYIAELTHYHMKGGQIFASNGAMTASAPIDDALEHVVPAEDLDKALTIFGTGAEMVWNDDTLVFKSGRRRMTIKLLKPENVALIDPVEKKIAVPSCFVERLSKIRPFISDDATRPWALTAWLHKGPKGSYVWTATNNISVVDVDAGKAEGDLPDGIDVQVPNFAIDFVASRSERLTHIGLEQNKATFYFEDGTQMTTMLFSVKMPEAVPNILKDAYEPAEGAFELTGEWREAYRTITALSPEEVVCGRETMTAGRRQATMEIEVSTPGPSDQAKSASVWNPKFFTPVVEKATHIDFASYPAPVRFHGPNIRGLTIGKTI